MTEVNPIHQMLKPVEGGTTRPWRALVDTGEGFPVVHVVKFFHERYFEHANHLAAEVGGSILCQQFDISTPEFCLTEFPDMNEENCPTDLLERLSKDSYPQPWFSSVSLDPSEEYSDALSNRYLEMFEVANLFAFDCLILNSDRRTQKPNLLFKNGELWAIDHDKAFGNHQPSLANFPHYASGHLFYDRLRKYCKKEGFTIFDTFAENLRLLNLWDWKQAMDRLEQMGKPFVARTEWESYLLKNKNNPREFVSLLSETLK